VAAAEALEAVAAAWHHTVAQKADFLVVAVPSVLVAWEIQVETVPLASPAFVLPGVPAVLQMELEAVAEEHCRNHRNNQEQTSSNLM